MIPEFGLICIILAFSLALLQIFIYNSRLANLAIMRPVAFGQTFFICLSFLFLAISFVNNDFSVNFIAQNSNSNLPIYYKITAIWGAHEGSLLLWVFILGVWGLLLAIATKSYAVNFSKTALVVFAQINIGFMAIMLYASNPFARTIIDIPIEGMDLNPMLQDFGMIVHPPILYLGYVGSTVGFALTCAAVANGKLNIDWAKLLRPWVLASWAFLTLGIALGSWWAYYELGWGGWWFWDPVENASFMPWLTSTALLHSLSINIKRGQLMWLSVALAIITFMLCLFGTFLVRSGAVMSVHAFANDPKRGVLFLILIVAMLATTAWFLYSRFQHLKLPKQLSLTKRDLFLFANAVLLLVATGTIFLGTVFPIIASWFGVELAIAYPYFNIVFLPIISMLLLMMPFLFYRFKAALLIIISASFLSSVFLYLNFAEIKIGALCGVAIAFSIVLCCYKYKKISMTLAHFGLAVTILGISITPAYEIETEQYLTIGDDVNIGNFSIKFKDMQTIDGPNYVGFVGDFLLTKGNKQYTLQPQKNTYLFPKVTTSETAILGGIREDVYIAIGQKGLNNEWVVRIFYKPYVRCIWLGAIIMAISAAFGALLYFLKAAGLTSLQEIKNKYRVCNYVHKT